ncbi:MAG: class I SAM-dependent methyltransferase [Chloroflexota bacterium]|nr:class I SAM-dependent methyltransferase [Chloroflexota bacterium]MDE2840186.1 class I SAM-dependent methyltransferase [Chloroflexota bacterium]MDE2931141.1 class I SAM-dependent methyltransferase [Chloroflexota bacterium]
MSTHVFRSYVAAYEDSGGDRLGLFTLMAERFSCRSALYPGSFDHVTPAFVFPNTCFVDMDTEAARFFADPGVKELVAQRKVYAEEPRIRFYETDYEQDLPEAEASFDLLISLNAGFVSQHCRRYLKVGGMLLVNNLHGDASMARLDPDYVLVGAINRRGARFSLAETDLASYFVPKRDLEVTREYLARTKQGVAFTRRAFAYAFRRVR